MKERLVDIESVVDLSDIIDALQDLSPEELIAHGLSADNTWDEIDDPVLIGPDGLPIETWREGYPYDERMSRAEYEVDEATAADRAAEGAGVDPRHRPEVVVALRGA